MNAEILAQADPHVQEEFAKLRDLNGVMERALELASDAYTKQTPVEDLPGSPPSDPDDKLAWLDYWIRQGALVYHTELAQLAL